MNSAPRDYGPNPHDGDFDSLVSGLNMTWDLTPPNDVAALWRPKDGERVLVDPYAGEELRNALLAEYAHIKNSLIALGEPDSEFEVDLDLLYTDALLMRSKSTDMPILPGESLTIEGTGIVFFKEEDGTYKPRLVTPKSTLFGRIIGPAFTKYLRATPEAINAYDPDGKDVLRHDVRTGVVLVLTEAALCETVGYGALRDRSDTAVVPIQDRNLALLHALET